MKDVDLIMHARYKRVFFLNTINPYKYSMAISLKRANTALGPYLIYQPWHVFYRFNP